MKYGLEPSAGAGTGYGSGDSAGAGILPRKCVRTAWLIVLRLTRIMDCMTQGSTVGPLGEQGTF